MSILQPTLSRPKRLFLLVVAVGIGYVVVLDHKFYGCHGFFHTVVPPYVISKFYHGISTRSSSSTGWWGQQSQLSQARNKLTKRYLQPHSSQRPKSSSLSTSMVKKSRSNTKTTPTELRMVFDFVRERSREGFDQLGNLGDKFKKGQLGQGLLDIAAYTAKTNKAFAQGLARSRAKLLDSLEGFFAGIGSEDSSINDEMMEELVDVLIQADLGIATAEDIVAEVKSLRKSAASKKEESESLSRDDLKSIMRGKMIESLYDTQQEAGAIQFSTVENQPTVLFIMGANGMGKTTTIGKLAYRLKNELNQTVLLAACDTFRAAAVDQLEQWADRAQVDIVGSEDRQAKTPPSAVLSVALDKALAGNYDTLVVDTSGRLSNNIELTDELAHMKRLIQEKLPGSDGKPNTLVPHETLLVLDAAQGRMALDSAKVWEDEIGLTGLILTKLDGTARGGSIVSITRELKLPVKLVGVGEGIEDLRDFDPEAFVDGLLGVGEAGGGKSADEGALLAARLEAMRNERDARASERSRSGTKKKSAAVSSKKKKKKKNKR